MKALAEEGTKFLTVREAIIGDFSNDMTGARKFLCSGPLFIVEKVMEPPKKWMYFFLFNDRLVETIPELYEGKPVKDMLDAFSKLRVIKQVDELKSWKFRITKEFVFNLDVELVNVQQEETVCKHQIVIKSSQIPYRFSSSTLLECDVWISLIFDQLEKIRKNEKAKLKRRNAVNLESERKIFKETLGSFDLANPPPLPKKPRALDSK
ncbi:hypothetical protein EIN_170230 [Entamoeba invadens IP1]|uniref:PH domain-containing protein n=2 Tax=Entamoeba invadens IP1 TaxID=370355 RepID=A0A0A1U0V3_ENTIV|nr:hypothetical protein EIN_170230 [Entamoeba invadens IP1]ELP84518.1 hypothetical protein EIN_170230 [Entamoeba invadens IP1]|eukprot:XP_004183864.1 hypothetical protein EIN_170230 [Entamoeba invadens IP1]